MPAWQDRYLDRLYRSKPGWKDGTTEFHELCARYIPAGGRILEVGAGPDNPTTRFLATLGEVHGLDPDPEVLGNSALAGAAVLDDGTFPHDDSSFDACVSNYVLEHVSDPLGHLSEVRRVLTAGGCYIFRTPNRNHYVALAARFTPYSFHRLVANRLRNLPADAHDPYPTEYLANSRRRLRKLARTTGFTVETLRMVEKEPSYGLASRPLFALLAGYERLVNRTELMAALRANIFGVLRRAEPADPRR